MRQQTTLLLIRHGDSHHTHERVTGGPTSCRGLTDLGRQQAALLRDRLAGDRPVGEAAALYCSTLPRARETAAILAPAVGALPVQEDCGLCTWHIAPEADGLTWDAYRARAARPDGGLFRPFETGNEAWAEMVSRICRALMGLVQRHAGQTIVVVGHKETVEASFVAFGHQPLLRPFDLDVANTSLTQWHCDGDPLVFPPPRWTLARCNDTAHLLGARHP